MAKFLALQIKMGKITIGNVPEHLKEAVQALLSVD